MQHISIETITAIWFGINDVFVYCLLEQQKPVARETLLSLEPRLAPFTHAYTCGHTNPVAQYGWVDAFSVLQNNEYLDIRIIWQVWKEKLVLEDALREKYILFFYVSEEVI